MIKSIFLGVSQSFSKPLRPIFWKTISLTLLLIIASAALFHKLLMQMIDTPYLWLDSLIPILAALGILISGLVFMPSLSIIVAGLFLDDIAERIEKKSYPGDQPGKALKASQAIGEAIKFSLIVLIINLLALILLLVPGINIIVFFLANSYLLGREYFEMVAMRHMSQQETRHLRKTHAGTIFIAGFPIAFLISIPILNLLTPLFAVSYMVHLFKQISAPTGKDRR